jgi:hypothetical protein
MRLIILALFLLSTDANADLKRYWNEFYPDSRCIPSQVLGLYITGTLGKRIYETHGDPHAGATNVVLEMHSREFQGPGKVLGVPIRYVGHQPIKAANGFPVDYAFVEECSITDQSQE